MSIVQTRQNHAAKSCGCSGGTRCQCGPSRTPFETIFSRPNFFAGQLLTDEDLRDAMDYMVQKNRLHNRHLFGEGVVCGLQVDPHPCPEDRHKVIVRKGHAINGCGDDIVVIRDQEIDIIKMASELLKRQRGYGCDDPCRDRQFAESDIPRFRKELEELKIDRQLTNDSVEIADIERRIAQTQQSLEKAIQQATPVKYGLYVRYTERQSDFVTPYQIDPCSTTRCQGSRIREGYEFELRCHESPTFPDIRQVIDQCARVIPDFEKLQGTTLHAICTIETVEKIVTQFKALEGQFAPPPTLPPTPPSTTPQQDLLKELMKALDNVKAKLSDATIPPDTSSTKLLAPNIQRDAIEAIHQLGTLAFRSHVFLAAADFPKKELLDIFNIATTSASSDSTEPKLVTKCKLLVQVKPVSNGLAGVSSGMIDLLVERLVRLKKILEKPEDFKEVDFDMQADAVGELIHADIVFATLLSLNAINKRLLSLMASGGIAFVPELRSAMYEVQLRDFSSSEDLTDPFRFGRLKTQAETVNRAVSEVTRQCMCRAILPPVPTDSSSAVLIANVTLNDCEVTEICNLARRFVISGPAFRYWFSEFNGIFGSLRQSCCPDEDSLKVIEGNEKDRLTRLQQKWRDIAKPTTVVSIVDNKSTTDYADNPSSWERLHAASIPESARVAVTPTARVVDALSAFREFLDPVTGEHRNNHQQEMSQVLAQMAVRPDTDLRNLLAWSESFTSPAEVMKVAKDAKDQAANATSKISVVESMVVTAKQIAEVAKTAADDANAKVIVVETKADTAQTAADNAKTVADDAAAKAILAETKADIAKTDADNADAKAIAADTKADAAQTAADNAKTAADKAVINVGAAETKADEAKALAQTAQFDHDNVPGTPDRTVQDVVQIIRTELDNGGTWNIARITSLLQTIVNG